LELLIWISLLLLRGWLGWGLRLLLSTEQAA
jgi:hypothetical protein